MSRLWDIAPELANLLYTDFRFHPMLNMGLDVGFAMLAALGFGYACNPPKKILLGLIAVAGLGYLARSVMLLFPVFSLAGASFLAALFMGLGALFIAKRTRVPVEVIVFPCLLPLFPGSYGYKSIIALLTFLQDRDESRQLGHLLAFFNNFVTMTSVSLSLVAGALVTFIIFFEQSFMITRDKR